MADEEEERSDGGAEPGRPGRPRLRRRPLGYRRGDVDAALEERDRELAELRQDIGALWLAFAQHDRMLREISGEAPPPAAAEPATGARAAAEPEQPPSGQQAGLLGSEAASIGSQLSELDEVLAAIEMATQTLERTYAEEAPAESTEGEPAAEGDPGEADEGEEPDR